MVSNSNEHQPFNPNEHLMKIGKGDKAADYLPVQWRIVWFRSLCPDGTIETEIVHLDLDRETEEEAYTWNQETRRSEKVIKRAPGFAVFRATVKDGKGGIAIGTKSEKAASFGDFIEKAETGAIGRALASLGYGTQFTGDEFDERQRIVDSPVETHPTTTVPKAETTSQPAQAAAPIAKPTTTQPAKASRAVTTESVPQIPQAVRNLKSQAITLGIAHDLAGWMAYKESVLGQTVPDRDLQETQIKALSAAMDHDKQAAKAS